jgi:hypothetical protein
MSASDEQQYYKQVLSAVQELSTAMRTVREQVSAEAATQIAPLIKAVAQLEALMYGDVRTRQVGIIERIAKLEDKIDQLIDQNEARLNQWKGMRTAIVVIGALSSVPALQALGKLFGLLP